MFDAAEYRGKLEGLFAEAFEKGQLEAVDEIVQENYRNTLSFLGDGAAGLKNWIRTLRAGVSDLTVTLEDFLADGDRTAARWVARMKHTGELFGAAATGNAIEVTGVEIVHWHNGRMAEAWECYQESKVMTAIGLLPNPSATS